MEHQFINIELHLTYLHGHNQDFINTVVMSPPATMFSDSFIVNIILW